MNLKSLLTDLRVGLSAVLAVQAVLLDALTSLGVPAKVISSAFGLIGAVLTAVQVASEASPVSVPSVPPTPPTAPPAAPPVAPGA